MGGLARAPNDPPSLVLKGGGGLSTSVTALLEPSHTVVGTFLTGNNLDMGGFFWRGGGLFAPSPPLPPPLCVVPLFWV